MRKLARTDLPALERILSALVKGGIFTRDEKACALELLGIALDQPDQQDYLVKVIETKATVGGFIIYGPVPLTSGTYDIYWIATAPALHGQGYGRRLLEQTELDLARRGARLICLETSSQGGYERTRRFYEQAGYREEARLADFYKPGDDRITYVKRFAPKEA